MCSVCGCNDVSPGDHAHGEHTHSHQPSSHPHSAPSGNGDGHRHFHRHDHYGAGEAGLSVPGFSQERLIEIERDILSRNDVDAAANRRRLHGKRSRRAQPDVEPRRGQDLPARRDRPGAPGELTVAVVEGDQETSNDAERIRACKVPAVQINTGRGCHLDAHMVGHALDELPLEAGGAVFIENVGNLVCPAAFDLGETSKVVILSVTEGDDKPLKYPDMFAAADLLLLNKTDLLPHVDFDPEWALECARRVNPDIVEMRLSARSGEGMAAWLDWVRERAHRAAGAAKNSSPDRATHRDRAHA